jgi:hypothetical protein
MEQRFPDNNFVVLNAKCSETDKYLMKFKKTFGESVFRECQQGIINWKEPIKLMKNLTTDFLLAKDES